MQSHQAQWQRLLGQQRSQLENLRLPVDTDLNEEDDFVAAVKTAFDAHVYGSGFQSSIRLTPNLGRVGSLVAIISSIAGVVASSTLVWQHGLALLKIGLEYGNQEDVLAILCGLNETVPRLDTLPESATYHSSLNEVIVDVYLEYVGYCVFASKEYTQQKDNTRDRESQVASHTRLRRQLRRVRDEMVAYEKRLFRKSKTLSENADDSPGGRSRPRKTPNTIALKHEKTIVHILPPKSSQFVRREKELDAMEEILRPEVGQIKQCKLHGMGGVGKTEIALEYAYRHMADYEAVFWIDAEQEAQRVRAYIRIGKKLFTIEDEVLVGGAEEIDKTREKLEDMAEGWLLIFDNVEQYSDVSLFVPSAVRGFGSVIYTTQKATLGSEGIKSIIVEPFAPKDGSALLLQNVKSEIDDDLTADQRETLAESISEKFDGHPIVLAMAGGFIKQAGITLADYLDQLKESTSPWPERGEKSAGRYTNPNACFDIALRELPPKARELIRILAFLNPEVSDELLVFDHEDLDLAFLNPKQKRLYCELAFDLRDRNLVKRQRLPSGPYYFQTHRFLQHKVLQKLNSDKKLQPELQKAFQQTLHILRRATPHASAIQVPTPDLWVKFERTLPHLISLQAAVASINLPGTLEYARLLSDAGMNMWERGLSADGLRLLEEAEQVLKDLGSKEDLLMANINVIIVLLIWDHGISRRKESLDRIKNALTIRQNHQNNKLRPNSSEIPRTDDILLHNAWSDYAVTLLQFGNVKDAEQIFERCLKKYKTWGTEDEIPYEYAKYYHHKSFCNLYNGNMDDAVEHARKGLALMRQATANDSSLSYRFQFDLASILFQKEDIERALILHYEVLEKRLGWGKYSFLTLQSYYAIGSLKAHISDFEAAEKFMRLALEGARKSSWPDVAVARTEFHLAKVLRAQDKLSKEVDSLECSSMETLDRLLPLDPLGPVPKGCELALFDHMQPVFDARFAGRALLQFVSKKKGKEEV